MGVSVLATLVSSDGDDAEYDMVADPADPPVRVRFRWADGRVQPVPEYDRSPMYVRAGIRAVVVARADTGRWPPRAVRQS